MAEIGPGAYGEALSLALRNYLATKPINQIWTQHPLFDTLKRNASSASGPELVVPVQGGSVASPDFTSNGSGLFTASVSDDIVSSAKYTWSKPLVGHIRLRYQDLAENAGKTQLADRLRVHIDDLLEQTRVKIVTLLHTENGVLPSGGFASLDTLCNADVAEVGAIDNTDSGNEFWTPYTENSPSSDPRIALRRAVQAIQKQSNGARPNVIHCGEAYWNAVLEFLDDKASITSGVGGSGQELEWESVRYGGVEIRWDYDAPDDRIYLLNTSALYFKYLQSDFMRMAESKQVDEVVDGGLQISLDEVYPCVTIMAVGTNERRKLGLITNFTGA